MPSRLKKPYDSFKINAFIRRGCIYVNMFADVNTRITILISFVIPVLNTKEITIRSTFSGSPLINIMPLFSSSDVPTTHFKFEM